MAILTFLFEVCQCSISVGLKHGGIKTDAVGIVGDSLVEIFALDGFVSLGSFPLGHFASFLFILLGSLVLKIFFVIL
jgi:hypothetical protein